ncbi:MULTISPECIES: acyl-CoA dehydrogenase [unclassified Streptomyces]|uniref:acyl-CoA dehydrogenase n=1 Tax=unclassified Streptomyces TaxID=2593676 RepID=UPI000DB8FF27|nr:MULTISPECIES: acyl-CoA dehydrogenase [unclassified Streptomyces]MYT68187.1 acyl-CoA dehydrogenase [Streptomyces sp. SID8367]RAJ72758.1 alkylation response protein AidB-like acyl-CoA dehydrogenase [Streptomyces sp. PsTaAH-137]
MTTPAHVLGSDTSFAAESSVAGLFAAFVDGEAADVPFPGRSTARRFAVLTSLGRRDLSLARLAEGHLDAAAVLHEIAGLRPRAGERWGVWAARPPQPVVHAARAGDDWKLNGVKPYCSGARACTHALVSAESDDGYRLFSVALDSPGVVPVLGTWPAVGMADSDSLDVSFTDVPARAVGEPGAYLDRPGFLHGGVGVAACWLGGAHAVAAPLYERAAAGHLNDHAAAHLGAADVLLDAADTVMRRAAEDIDADPGDSQRRARVRGLRTRALVEKTCTEVLGHVGRATGAGPLCHDEQHARAVADLTVYIRQHHAEANLAELGHTIAEAGQEAAR